MTERRDPDPIVIVSELRLLAQAAQRNGKTRTQNVALLAAALIESYESDRLLRRARAVHAAQTRNQKLTPAHRKQIAQHASRSRKIFQSSHAVS